MHLKKKCLSPFYRVTQHNRNGLGEGVDLWGVFFNELTDEPDVSATLRIRFLLLDNKPLRKKATSCGVLCTVTRSHTRSLTDARSPSLSGAQAYSHTLALTQIR